MSLTTNGLKAIASFWQESIDRIIITTEERESTVTSDQFTLSVIENNDTWRVEFPMPDNSPIRRMQFLDKNRVVLSDIETGFSSQMDMRFTYRITIRNGGVLNERF